VTGTEAASAATDASGNYVIVGLPCGGTYTVAASKAGYTFSPPSITYANLAADQLAANFDASVMYGISGRVTLGGTGLSGVTVTLTGSQGGSTSTDSAGNYSFAYLVAGGNYTVTPSRSSYSFNPPSAAYSNLSANQTANFEETLITYAISGRVMLGGAGLPGVTMNLSGSQGGSTSTDGNGNYSFAGLPSGGSYTVSPSRTGYSFSPPSTTYANLSANQTAANFSATLITYAISGRVTLGGAGFSGVTMSLAGSQGASVATDSNGNYSFAALPAGGNYTVTPSRAGYTFSPPSTAYTNLSANQTTANFAATEIRYTITGQVAASSGGVSGVTMGLSGTQTLSGSTDASGFYSFSGLAAGGNYTVTPSKANFTFSPASASFTGLGGNQTANFWGNQYPRAVQVYPSNGLGRRQTLTFTFRDPDGYSDLEWTQVEINSSLGSSPGCVIYFQVSDSTHVYLGDNTWNPQWRQVTFGSGSAVTTSQGMCKLYPASSSRSLNSTDVTLTMDLEFPPAFSGVKGVWMSVKDYSHASYVYWVQMGNWWVPAEIGGRVTMGGSGVSGVTMNLSGYQYGSTTTDASGAYSFAVSPGSNYTVTPSKLYYVFDPASTSVYGASGTRTADFAVKATVAITNLTRPGHNTDFRVGDNWTLTINGPPYQTVSLTATFNGSSSSSTYGQTNASGAFSMSGYMDPSTVGNWTEVWTVGPIQATPTLVFTVSP
jgi:inhibitor of cysteine peptidase